MGRSDSADKWATNMFRVQGGSGGGERGEGGAAIQRYISPVSVSSRQMCQDSNTAPRRAKQQLWWQVWLQNESSRRDDKRSGGIQADLDIYVHIYEYIYTRITEENFTFYAACLFLKDIFLSLGHILRWTSVHKSYRNVGAAPFAVQPFFFPL